MGWRVEVVGEKRGSATQSPGLRLDQRGVVAVPPNSPTGCSGASRKGCMAEGEARGSWDPCSWCLSLVQVRKEIGGVYLGPPGLIFCWQAPACWSKTGHPPALRQEKLEITPFKESRRQLGRLLPGLQPQQTVLRGCMGRSHSYPILTHRERYATCRTWLRAVANAKRDGRTPRTFTTPYVKALLPKGFLYNSEKVSLLPKC